MKRAFSALILAVFVGTIAVAENNKITDPAKIPIEAFAAQPDFSNVQLSPSGKKLAYFVSSKGRRSLVVQNLDGTNGSRTPPWDEKIDFDTFFWKSDNIIIFRVSMTLNRWEFKGKSHETRIISFTFNKKQFKWLGAPKVNNPNFFSGKDKEITSQHERIVDYLVDDPNHILLEFDFQLDGTPSVYKTNVKTGARSIFQYGRRGINDWYTDQDSKVRLGSGYRPHSTELNMIYKNADGKWIDLDALDWTDKYDLESFDVNPAHVYVTGVSEYGTRGIYKLDVLSGEIIEPVFVDPEIDVEDTHEHPTTGRLAGAIYVDDHYRIKYLDKGFARLQAVLNKAMPNTVNLIVGKARDAELYLIQTSNDRSPGEYYLYDRTRKKLVWMMSARRFIEEAMMATVEGVSIPVRDGSNIPAYLTTPKGTLAQNLPAIILPHGGPTARDTADWDYWAQFYASRGYLVLQPNFRGSSGYGPAFENAGKLQWGGLMQDDVTDATKWLVAKGIADPERICIVGASYGGYAALMGTIKEPKLYRCAVSVNGVTDLLRLKAHDRNFIGGRAWIKNMGLAGVDDKQASPYHRAEEINAPVLLLSAKDDSRIPYQHSKDLHKRLKRLKKDSHYVLIKSGTHSMVTAESRLTMLRETEKFLAKHIGN